MLRTEISHLHRLRRVSVAHPASRCLATLWVSIALLCVASGCDEDGVGGAVVGCSADDECAEGEICVEGSCAAQDGDMLNEQDDDEDPLEEEDCVGRDCIERCEPACRQGEACVEGRCVCIDGVERSCGFKTGECTYGTQTCFNNSWTQCEGGIMPVPELCDHLDNDCDGEVDEEVQNTYFQDLDNDGWGTDEDFVMACERGDGFSERNGDCDDNDGAVNPGADEVCDGFDNDCDELVDVNDDSVVPAELDCAGLGVCAGAVAVCGGAEGWACEVGGEGYEDPEVSCDGLDNDCDGLTDENLKQTYYRDADGDTFGDPGNAIRACAAPPGYVLRGQDCDDTDGTVHPDAAEVCDGRDNDCDELLDAADDDLERPPSVCLDQGVCADTAASCAGRQGWRCLYPDTYEVGAEVSCDDLDNDCDGQTDEGMRRPYFLDADGDTYGDLGSRVLACAPPTERHILRAEDCNDAERSVYPGAAELCDNLDNDCDQVVDEDITRPCGSNLGVCTRGVEVCEAGVFGECSGREGVPPTDDESAQDLCDSLDNDCDGLTDEGCTCQDGDSLPCGVDIGQCTVGEQVCANGAYGECSGQGPVAEVCDPDFLDQNCDGLDDIAAGLTTAYYVDNDRDGFGAGPVRHKCGPLEPGQASRGGDCNDGDDAINPNAVELCNGIDDNCNELVDDEPRGEGVRCLQDGVCQGTEASCQGAQGWRCLYGGIQGFEPEEVSCDGLDNDCDGQTDEELTTAYFNDQDRDGYGFGPQRERCGALVPGQAPRAGDCDDSDPDVYPGAVEVVADGVDQSCDGRELCYVDADEDGFRADAPATVLSPDLLCDAPGEAGRDEPPGDCDDDDRRVNPGAAEICDNNVDDNCDGQVDEGCQCDRNVDADFDGSNECNDCDDSNGAVFPGAQERCNGVDDDCDGLIDEDFDQDNDNFSVCAINPEERDCDDTDPDIFPGADENCDNNVDDNCNGYINEGCGDCDPNDTDGDGVSECDGDCDPDSGDVFPGAEELCDGVDNDCNLLTNTNCDVSEPCNWGNDNDICQDDLLCACIINNAGQCQDDYICTALCNTSETGELGDGCAEDQVCLYDLLYSANIHGCAVVTDGVAGARRGGETCGDDTDCRSNNCDRLCTGPGCNQRYCLDWCGSDAYCEGEGTVCRVTRRAENMDGLCWPADGPFVDANGGVGDDCARDTACDHGLCGNFEGGTYCTEGCCSDSDCPNGYSCSLRGDQVLASVYLEPPNAADCNNDGDCDAGMVCRNNKCTWNVSETTPMCERDEPGQGDRVAGAACDENSDCASNFCERDLGVCVDVCCSDSACPEGLACDMVFVQTTPDLITQARVCLNLSTEDVIQRR